MPLSHHVILGLPVTELQAKASKGLAGWLESRNTNNTRANGIIITTTHYKTNTFSRRRFTLVPAPSINWTSECL